MAAQQEMGLGQYKLYYFDFRGRAEVCRLVFALAGQDFEDVRWGREEWPKYKEMAPYKQAPFLDYDGKLYGQSSAIAAFLANQFGLYGKGNMERLRIDEVIGIAGDLFQLLGKIFVEKDNDQKKKMAEDAVANDFPRFFGFFSKLLVENGSKGTFVGDGLTLGEMYLYDIVYSLKTVDTYHYNAGFHFPEVKKMVDKVEGHEKLKAYLAKRKDTPF